MAENVENKSKRDLVPQNVDGQGLDVLKYEAGDMRDRLAKVRELANERDDVRFSVGDEGESRVGFEPRSIDDLSEDEKAELGDFVLGGNYVSELTGGEFPRTGERGIVDRIANYYKEKYNGLVTREGLGDVELDRRGVKDSINHIRITNKNIAAFAAVPDIIERGYIIDHKEDWQERGYETTTIAAPIKIGNGSFVGVVVVRKGQKTQTFRFYLHRITPQKYLLDESPTDTEADTRQEGIANVLRKIANAKKNRDNLTKNNGQEPEARFSIGDTASTLGRNLGKEIDVTDEGRREQDRYILDPEQPLVEDNQTRLPSDDRRKGFW